MNWTKIVALLLGLVAAIGSEAQTDFWMKTSTSENPFTSHQFHAGDYQNGTYYYCGEFWRDISFGTFEAAIPVGEDNQDAFILQTDAQGNEQNLLHFTGNGYERISDLVALDNGEIWLCGFFNQTFSYDTVSFQATGFYDTFLLHLDAEGGVLDAFQFFGQGSQNALNFDALAVDSQGQIWVLANFGGTVQIGQEIIEGGFSQDGLLIHFSKTGEILDIHHFATPGDGEENFLYLNALAVDKSDNVIVGGTMTGAATVDSMVIDLNPESYGQAVLFKYNSADQLLWSKVYNSFYSGINTITIGADQEIIAGVQFQSSFEFDGEEILGNGSFSEMVLIGVGTDGDALWYNAFTKDDFQAIGGIYPISIVEQAGRIFVGGFYSGTIVNNGETILESGDNQWAYILELEGDGTLSNVFPFSSAAYARVNFLAAGSEGISFGGEYAQSIIFQDQSYNSVNSTLFYGLIFEVVNDVNQFQVNEEVKVFPNPFHDDLRIQTQMPASYQLEIFNLLGQKVWEEDFSGTELNLDLNSLAPGHYNYIFKAKESIRTGKLVKH
jgi:hypothetical protein